jgi:hypothetical protein
LGDLFVIGDVQGEGSRLTALGYDFRRHTVSAFLGTSRDGDLGTLLGEGQRDGASYAPSSPGNEGNLVFKKQAYLH